MNKTSMLLVTVAAFALSAPAFAADTTSYESNTKIEKDADGDYSAKSKTENTDSAGTTSTSEKKVDVDVDSKGNVDKTVKSEETTDPKGLMNKKTVKTKDTAKTKADGTVETKHKKTVNGHTTESTTEITK